ncbi:type II CAAX endopeptidase family protein [Erythrobacter alti]|uniref:CPBP family intramembrane glutamic endopeptidase n=1 Tax=Erythrobacter alti TaxID=1896145 RepID=UPI0030F408AC
MDSEIQTESRSMAKRIWQFPLVAMIVGLVLILAAAAVTSVIVRFVIAPNLDGPIVDILAVLLIVTLCGLTYKLLVRKLGPKQHDDLPLDMRAVRDTAAGFGLGAVLISVCVGLAALAGVYRITGTDNFADGVQIIFWFGIYAGFFEELVTRGIILRWLEEFAGSWIALVLSALIFGFGHAANDNATVFSSLAIAIEAGILLGAAYMLTRSLWLAIGIHAGWNVVQALWDVPVSGNPTSGPIAATLDGPWL